jgi:hypothetical protein
MATYACKSCGNLHGAPVLNCGMCGSPNVALVPDDPIAEAIGVGPFRRTAPTPEQLAWQRDVADRDEARERRLDEARERREKDESERIDRLVGAGVALLGALVKLVDRTPSLVPSSPKVTDVEVPKPGGHVVGSKA